MGATTNVTTVHYGTTWDDCNTAGGGQANQPRTGAEGRHKAPFPFDWQEVAAYNPDYLAYVEGERARLGEDHPLFMTQYRLLPIKGGGRLFSAQQRAQLQGTTPGCTRRRAGGTISRAGSGRRGIGGDDAQGHQPRQDSTALTIGEVSYQGGGKEPVIAHRRTHILDGQTAHGALPQLVDLLGRVWRCQRVAVDATGIGQPVASFLRGALGSKITPFVFTAQSKSELGFNLLAAATQGV